jgi:two-component sensor histidine kinase/tetratricopeptide (TPR) repeat protein
MASRFLFLISFFFTMATVLAQEITRQDADSMLLALKKSKTAMERFDLLLSVAQFHIFKPGESQVDFDSADVYLKEAVALNASLKSPDASGYLLLTKSFLTREKGQRDSAKKMTEEAMNILEKGKNKSYLGKAYYELSQYYNCCSSPVQLNIMIPLVERAIDAFQQAGNMERKAFSLKMLGDLLNIDGQNQKALEALKRAVAVYDSIHNTKLQGVYALMGRIYFQEADNRQALQYLLLALKAAEIARDSSMEVCQIYNYLGNIYNRQWQHELSHRYYKNALEIARKHEDGFSIMLIMTGIASSYSIQNKDDKAVEFLESIPKKYLQFDNDDERIMAALPFLRAYNGAHMFDKAKPYLNLVIKLAGNKEISEDLKTKVYRVVAGYYLRTKNYSVANVYLAKNKFLRSRANESGRLLDLELQYRIDSAQGLFQTAFSHLRDYKNLNDSILSATKTKQLQQLEIEYETIKKQDTIKLKNQDILFLTQTNKLQQENLKQARLIRNVIVAVVILSIISIIQLYRQYRHKQKSNTVITHKNEQLQHYLTEKEWLLKEIHHRVKNNLQIVMSLLNSQSAYIENESALTAIHDSQHRVHAMSLIHQKLYNTENLSSIDMSLYIRELASYLADSFNMGQRIRFELAIEPLEMDVSQAVPLGLILNEAITNSIKYAFPNDEEGVIKITLSNTSRTQYLLEISDDGIGIPYHLKNKKTGSLGMSLMAGLSEDLDGSFSIENNNGTVIRILFVHDMGVKRPASPISSFVTSN